MSAKYKKRFEVIFLVTHPKGPKMSVKAAAKYTKCSASFVRKWINRYQATGNVDDIIGRGLQRATTKAQDKEIKLLFDKNPHLTLRQAKEKLLKKGINLSIYTIRARLKEIQVEYRSTIQKPLLTEKQVKRRLEWAHVNKDRDWTNVMFTDESSFWVMTTRRNVWRKKNEMVLQRTVKHPVKVHVYGCFSYTGFGRLLVFLLGT